MFKIELIENPAYISADKSRIDCTVKFSGFNSSFEFTADANDSEAHSKTVHAEIVAGKWGDIADYAAPPEKAPVIKQAETSGLKSI